MSDDDQCGKDLWDIQKGFNDKFFATKGGWPKEDQLVAASKDFAIHLIKETTEVLDELSFKMHRAGKDSVDRANVIEEMIDVQKFLWGWMQVWGVTWEEFTEEFKRKSTVVDQRFEQEQTFPGLSNHPCCIIDIDGVLAEYPGFFYQWSIENFYPTHSITEFIKLYKSMNLLSKEDLKKKYRQSGVKASMPLVRGAKELLHCIRRRSALKIILMTNRPYAEFYRLYPDTLAWLKKNDLPYDGIIWSRDKGVDALKGFKNIMWAVDDNPENVRRFREANITTIMIRNEFQESSTHALYLLTERIQKMEDVGFAWAVSKTEVEA